MSETSGKLSLNGLNGHQLCLVIPVCEAGPPGDGDLPLLQHVVHLHHLSPPIYLFHVGGHCPVVPPAHQPAGGGQGYNVPQ